MGYDRKGFAAALIAMAVKGYMMIAEDDGEYTLTRTNKNAIDAGLSRGEKAIGAALFDGPGDSIVLRQSNHSRVARAISALKSALTNEYERKYFVTNIGWFVTGAAILVVTVILSALMADEPEAAFGVMLWLSIWSVGTALLLHRAYMAWHGLLYGPGSRIMNFFSAIFTSLFALFFTAVLIGVFGVFLLGVWDAPLTMVLLSLGGFATYLFYILLKAPTALGAKILDQVEGFRLYLDTAEKDRLEVLHPPELTPKEFEKCLPFAIALDCENRWSKRFEREMAAASADTGRMPSVYSPLWYSGGSFSRLGTAVCVCHRHVGRQRGGLCLYRAGFQFGLRRRRLFRRRRRWWWRRGLVVPTATIYRRFLPRLSSANGPGPIPTRNSNPPAIAMLRANSA